MDNQNNQGQPQDMTQAANAGGPGQQQNQGMPTPPPGGQQPTPPPAQGGQGGTAPQPGPPQGGQPTPGAPQPGAPMPGGAQPPAGAPQPGAPMPPQQPMPGAPTPPPAAPPQGGQGGMPPPQGGGTPAPGAPMPPQGGAQPPAGGTPPPTGPEPAANFQLGQLIKEIKIKLPKHSLQFDETRFLQLLAGSISLSKDEKKRIVGAIPRLSQEQVNELIRIFEEERQKFAELSARHVPELERLAKQYAADWEDIEMSFAQSEKASEDQNKADEIRKNLGI